MLLREGLVMADSPSHGKFGPKMFGEFAQRDPPT